MGEKIEESGAKKPRKLTRRWKIVIGAVATPMVVIIIFVLIFGFTISGCGCVSFPAIATIKQTNEIATIWTVTAIGGVSQISKSDVYVQVKKADSTFVISTVPLLSAMGTKGFGYISTDSSSDKISVGDVFYLDKAIYAQGSTIVLVAEGATGQYAILTV